MAGSSGGSCVNVTVVPDSRTNIIASQLDLGRYCILTPPLLPSRLDTLTETRPRQLATGGSAGACTSPSVITLVYTEPQGGVREVPCCQTECTR